MGSNSSGFLIVCSAAAIGLIVLTTSGEDSEPKSGTGLSNLGNTCFLNALVQALSVSENLQEFLQAHLAYCQNSIVTELHNCIEAVRTGVEVVRPKALITALSEKFPHFGSQQDAHEIFVVIQDVLSTLPRTAPFKTLPQFPFLGINSTTIECTSCGNKRSKLEVFCDISLSVAHSIEMSFVNFCEPQRVEGVNCMYCSAAASIQEHEKAILRIEQDGLTEFEKQEQSSYHRKNKQFLEGQIRKIGLQPEEADMMVKISRPASLTRQIVRLPKVLCLHIGRLTHTSDGTVYKDSTLVKFPTYLIVPSQAYASPAFTNQEYKLCAVVEHIGSALEGHYVTYKEVKDQWYICSDEYVKEVPKASVMERPAYMLFYELRVPTPSLYKTV
mmetsp:Transcript_12255/g.23260  ORF Transcript_12255/g.23260 Transcript_12255/m.23260 type:complete len:386 (-) Transcript_12255:2494-3651(-)